ncbi:hypothetical protein [Vibrio quintilis]|uniref:Toxin coregulated pilus biosynthesis protein E n=1 Tax=Vibrio quintilis TaxID=1117707 RepID=A0A1M7YSH2_9VIBR|nr:hypothetical protein [Vibrio quintilis]SHO55562.1 Toxin coregulated pilus biosynthesis protein E [Vibrio quintilis]
MNNQFSPAAFKNWFVFIYTEMKKLWHWPKSHQEETLSTLSLLLKNKVYLKDAANLLIAYGTKKERVIGAKINRYMEDGITIDAVLESDLSLPAYEALSAGIYADNMEEGLDNAVEALKLSQSLSWALLWYFIKPIGGVVLACAMTAGYSAKILPVLEKTVKREQLPGLSIAVDYIGRFIYAYGGSILLALLCFLSLMLFSLPVHTGVLRDKLDRFPVYKQYRILVSAALLASLSNLTNSRVSLDESLKKIKQVASPYVASHLAKMIETIDDGEANVGLILDSGLLLEDQVQVLKILGQNSSTEIILRSSAVIHQNRLTTTVRRVKEYGEAVLKIGGYSLMLATFLGLALSVLSIISNIRY